jgi:hypothetical protein
LVEGGIYHVYNRVASGEPIFSDQETAIEFLELAREVKQRDGWTVFAWCLIENLADDVFCGHRELVRRIRKPLIDVDDALLCFGTTSRSARRAYNSGIRTGIEDIRKVPVSEPLEFRSLRWEDRELQAKPEQEHIDQLGRSTGRIRGVLKAVDYVKEVCVLLDTDVDRIVGRSRDRETAVLRRLISGLGVERWRQRCTDLGEALGKNPDVVSYWVVEAARRRREDPGFARRFDELDEELENATKPGRRRHSD